VPESLHAPALERVHARPLELELAPSPEHRAQARQDALGLFSPRGSASQPSWKSTRHTSSAWRCSSTDCSGWNGGSNQNQRSVGKSRRHADVGDQEAVAETPGLAFEPSMCAHGLRAPSHDDEPVARQRVVAIRRLDVAPHAVVRWRRRRRPCLPAQLDARQRRARRRGTPRSGTAAG
jgi:hypothetical protein